MTPGRVDPGLVVLLAAMCLAAGVVMVRIGPAWADHDGSSCLVGETAPPSTAVPTVHTEANCSAAAPAGGAYTWSPATTTTTTAPPTTTTTVSPELAAIQGNGDVMELGLGLLVFAAFAFVGLKAGR